MVELARGVGVATILMNMIRSTIVWSWGVLALCLAVAPARGVELSTADIENRRCLNCHGQSHIAELAPAERAQMVIPEKARSPKSGTADAQAAVPPTRPGLFVEAGTLPTSIHGKLACTDCHRDAKNLPHASAMSKVTCTATGCHTQPGAAFMQGVHATAAAKGDPNAPTCVTCHGGHDVLPKKDRHSRTFPLNIVKICGDCHQHHQPTTPHGADGKTMVTRYLESVHGRAVAQGGLAVAATCADCHGSHRVLAAKDERSSVHRDNIPQTCGHCHVGLSEVYATSVHGKELGKGNAKAPVCSDCHTAHAISRTDTPTFMLDIVNECGHCHDKPARSTGKLSLYETYRASYHGQVTGLGFTRAARCSDCHGAHNVQRIDDAGLRTNVPARVAMCRKCHKDATPQFAKFQPHADFHDAATYPLLHYVWLYFVVMMSASFGFFGLHSLLWFARSAMERIKHGPHPRFEHNGSSITRFTRVDRINHAFVIITFFGLALTGLPLLYSDKAWAKGLATVFGGPTGAGILHRIFAIMLIGNFVVHGVGVFRRFRKHGVKNMLLGPTTMLMTPKDAKDCLGMFKWFFLGGKKPDFDRWTYWEKFDYMAEVGGSGIIGLSGLLLWFPVFFSAFVPGWAFNIATIVHGFEALLAVGFIFTIHFFNAHLRLEKFPVDDVMFTGRLPEEEFKHERGAEYARLKASGELDKLRVPSPPAWYRHFAVAMGITAMAIGIPLIVLIVLAALNVI